MFSKAFLEALTNYITAKCNLAVATHANNERHPGYPQMVVVARAADVQATYSVLETFVQAEPEKEGDLIDDNENTHDPVGGGESPKDHDSEDA